MRISNLNYRHGKSLTIEHVELDQPYARFVINENLTTNASELIVPQPTPANEKQTNGNKPLTIHINNITINNNSTNFTNFNLTPNFTTTIQQMNNHINMLNNQKPQTLIVTGKQIGRAHV